MSVQPRVWTEVQLHPEALARLKAETDVIENATLEDLEGASAAIILSSTVDDAFVDQAGPALRLVIRHGVGYNTVNVPEVTARGVLSAYTPYGPTECTAEHAVGLLIGVAKKIVKGDRYLRANRAYTRDDMRGTELCDQTLGVIGYGRIGRRVAEICALGFKMDVIVYDPYLSAEPELDTRVKMVDNMEELLSQANFVTVHTPLLPETEHLIGERELRLMKPGAYLINVSRGPIVDESALIRVLEEGHLGGAGLDVFDPEPPRPDNPLLQMENVVVTPHIGGNTVQGSWRMSQSVVDQIFQVLAGERPTYLIDASAWPGRMLTANTSS